MLLRDMPHQDKWCGNELAVLLVDGLPFVFSGLLVWPKAQGSTRGAAMVIMRWPDDTLTCWFDGANPIRFGAISPEDSKVMVGDGPKYLPVRQIFFGVHELPIPIRPELRP